MSFPLSDSAGPTKVQCAVCRKQVDAVENYHDPARDETVFVICCHGEKETVVLANRDTISAIEVRFDGIAFSERQKAIA